MSNSEALRLLSGFREGTADANDPFFAQPLALVRSDSRLAMWWAQEQQFDRMIAERIGQIAAPAGLREALLKAINDSGR